MGRALSHLQFLDMPKVLSYCNLTGCFLKPLIQAEFALRTAINITEFYEKYFGIGYPLPKQDLIAIPDFGAGAMENWGLITYRETSLLYSPERSSASSQQWVAVVVAHELAHQWFGNLVTMQWWNDLWLNEGFASWMEYKGVAETQPGWAMEEQFWVNVCILFLFLFLFFFLFLFLFLLILLLLLILILLFLFLLLLLHLPLPLNWPLMLLLSHYKNPAYGRQ